MKNKSTKPEKWFTYFDDSPATSYPGWQIKVDDRSTNNVQSPIAILYAQTPKGKITQGRRARLIVKLANQHFRNR